MPDYPPNSRIVKRNEPQVPPDPQHVKPKIQPVVNNPVRRQEKGLGRKIKEAFVGDDQTSVVEHVFVNVLVPAFKNMVEDAVNTGIRRRLWGDSAQNTNFFNRSPGPWTNYAQPTTVRQPMFAPQQAQQAQLSPQAKAAHRFDELVFTARIDAENVLQGLLAQLAEYRIVSVRDFYDLIGESMDFPDVKYGWVDLSGAQVRPARGGGYYVHLPPTIIIT